MERRTQQKIVKDVRIHHGLRPYLVELANKRKFTRMQSRQNSIQLP